jgi:glutamine synthetase
MIHEEGAAQMEINLRHGNPLELADQVFLFKRTIREAALRHEMYATFMSKPMSNQPGSAMHIHQSVIDKETGRTSLPARTAWRNGGDFLSFIAGHQAYLPHVTCIMAPFVNSYRRFSRNSTSPVNVYWGYDNRTVGLRVPYSSGRPAAGKPDSRL